MDTPVHLPIPSADSPGMISSGIKEGEHMDMIRLSDSRNLLKIACGDLKALQSVMRAVDETGDETLGREAVTVAARALTPIITEIQEAIGEITASMEKAEEPPSQQ